MNSNAKCAGKILRRCEAAPTLQRSALQGWLFSTIKTSTWLKQSHAQETCQASDHYPSTKSSPVKLRSSKISLRPCHILRNGGNNSSGERRHLGSTLLPWKHDKMEEGCDVFRWEYTCLNRRLCQYRGLSPKQKKFCSSWNTFLWAEVTFIYWYMIFCSWSAEVGDQFLK